MDILLDDDDDETVKVNEEELVVKADEAFNRWFQIKIKWQIFFINDYGGADAAPHPKTLMDYFVYADPLKWMRKKGKAESPSMVFLARLTLSQCGSGVYQESVFSSASCTMGLHQTRMNAEQFEKRAILFHNRKFIAKNIEGILHI